MITKHFRITVALLVLAAMASLHVSAGQVLRKGEPLKIQGPVYLAPSVMLLPNQYPTTHDLIVINNTGGTIPLGTKINWSIKPSNYPTETKGSFTLQTALPPHQFARRRLQYGVELWGLEPFTAKAWYYK